LAIQMQAEQSQVIHVAGAVTVAGEGAGAGGPLLEALAGWIVVAAWVQAGAPRVTIANNGSEPLPAVSDARGHGLELRPGPTTIGLDAAGAEALQVQIGPLPAGAYAAGERHVGGVLTLVLSAGPGPDPGCTAFVGQAIGGVAR
jgi:hypothetical protein